MSDFFYILHWVRVFKEWLSIPGYKFDYRFYINKFLFRDLYIYICKRPLQILCWYRCFIERSNIFKSILKSCLVTSMNVCQDKTKLLQEKKTITKISNWSCDECLSLYLNFTACLTSNVALFQIAVLQEKKSYFIIKWGVISENFLKQRKIFWHTWIYLNLLKWLRPNA